MNKHIITFEKFDYKPTVDRGTFTNSLAKFLDGVEKTLSTLDPKGTIYSINTATYIESGKKYTDTAVVRFVNTKDTWVINDSGSRKTASGHNTTDTLIEEFAKNDALVIETKSFATKGSAFDKLPSHHYLQFKIDKKQLKVYPDENFFKSGERMKNPESWKTAKFPDFDLTDIRGEIISTKYDI